STMHSLFTPHYYHPLDFFLFTHPPPTDTYTLSLHDALPILTGCACFEPSDLRLQCRDLCRQQGDVACLAATRSLRRMVYFGEIKDRKSTRLNSSHVSISYAVFCLKKKNTRIPASASERSTVS